MVTHDVELIEDCYLRALALDPGNRAARFNFAVHRLRRLHVAEPDEPAARERLRDELEELARTAVRPPAPGLVSEVAARIRDCAAGIHGREADPIWWHATYAAAAEHAHAADAAAAAAKPAKPSKPAKPADAATAAAAGAQGAAAATSHVPDAATTVRPAVVAGLRVVGRWRWVWTPRARFAAELLPAVAVLYAGTASRDPICFVPDRAASKYHGRIRGRWRLRKCARHLCDQMVRRACVDLAELVRLVDSLPESRDARSRYNVACLYAASAHDKAVAEFERAVGALDAEMLEWARHDPSLTPVRETVVRRVEDEETRRAAVAVREDVASWHRRLAAREDPKQS